MSQNFDIGSNFYNYFDDTKRETFCDILECNFLHYIKQKVSPLFRDTVPSIVYIGKELYINI